MFGIDPKTVAVALLPWIAAGAAALLVVAGGIFVSRGMANLRASAAGAASRYGVIAWGMLGGVLLCGALTWAILHSAELHDRTVERRALEKRAQDLAAQALAPGSPLACLDGLAGDTVQAACERAVFATPANVAAAIAYVTARFTLLSDMADYSNRGGNGIGNVLQPLRRALEADPYGFLAYVLVTQDACTSERCPALALLPHGKHVRTNLIAQTLQHYVEQYRQGWARLPGEAGMQPPESGPAAMAEADAPGRHKVDIDFPSADSIPPISIMNPEPKMSPAAEAARKRPSTARTDPVWTPAPSQQAH